MQGGSLQRVIVFGDDGAESVVKVDGNMGVTPEQYSAILKRHGINCKLRGAATEPEAALLNAVGIRTQPDNPTAFISFGGGDPLSLISNNPARGEMWTVDGLFDARTGFASSSVTSREVFIACVEFERPVDIAAVIALGKHSAGCPLQFTLKADDGEQSAAVANNPVTPEGQIGSVTEGIQLAKPLTGVRSVGLYVTQTHSSAASNSAPGSTRCIINGLNFYGWPSALNKGGKPDGRGRGTPAALAPPLDLSRHTGHGHGHRHGHGHTEHGHRDRAVGKRTKKSGRAEWVEV